MKTDLTIRQRREAISGSMNTVQLINYTIKIEDDLVATIKCVTKLREALEYISFASNGCPVRYDSKDVPEEYQAIIRNELRCLGEAAEQALSCEYSDILPTTE